MEQFILSELEQMICHTVKKSTLYKILNAVKKIIKYKPEHIDELTTYIELITHDILYNELNNQIKAKTS